MDFCVKFKLGDQVFYYYHYLFSYIYLFYIFSFRASKISCIHICMHMHIPPCKLYDLGNAPKPRRQLVYFKNSMLISFFQPAANWSDKFTLKAIQRGMCINDFTITNRNGTLHQIVLFCCCCQYYVF